LSLTFAYVLHANQNFLQPSRREAVLQIIMCIMRPRFSLRGLLLLTACLAALLYWFSRPLQVANHFVAAIEAGDHKAAEAMFTTDDRELTNLSQSVPGWAALPITRSARDWFAGRYFIRLAGIEGGKSVVCYVKATAAGMEPAGKWYVAARAMPAPNADSNSGGLSTRAD
jgi:hypothetical protein